MIIDKELEMDAANTVTASEASVSHIDQGAAGDALGGKELTLVVRCATTADSATDAATVTVSLQTDDNSSFNSAKTLFTSGAFAIASAELTANGILCKVKLPVGAERYLRVYYTVANENLTAGKFDAFLVPSTDVGL